MSTTPLAEIRNARLQKIEALRALGLNPYPSRSGRTHFARPILENYEAYAGQPVTVAGRLMSWRKQGGLAFGHIQDRTGRIQLFLRRQTVRPTDPARGTLGYEEIGLLDVGDIVEAAGTVTRTQRGEISVLVEDLRLLTKSLRPLPDKWFGLRDRETILRKRYLDTTLNPEHRERFERISRLLFHVRVFLDRHGFLEFHTPVIQPQYGGGTARPFVTHVNALDCDMYLAISHELYLKRLIAAGYDRVYTIGRYFRNEGIDRSHHPEFSMIETMTAYANYEFNMDLIEELFRYVAAEAFGRTVFEVRGHRVDFGRPWVRLSMTEAVRQATGVDFSRIETVEEANARLRELGLAEPQESVGHALRAVFEERVAPGLIQPTLIYGHPTEISPLAKPMESDPRYAERFEIFIAGMECGDNWSEQNDPVELLERWRRSYRHAGHSDEEFHPIDYDFIECLEYGIPPTTGIGPGIERMCMIFAEQENIDDVIFFPMMRPVISPVNRLIYGIEERTLPAPRRDEAALSLDDFRSLLEEKLLRPHDGRIVIRPQLQLWPPDGSAPPRRVTGYFLVDGFLRGGTVSVTGFSEPLPPGEPVERMQERLEAFARETLREWVRAAFPECEVLLGEVAPEPAEELPP